MSAYRIINVSRVVCSQVQHSLHLNHQTIENSAHPVLAAPCNRAKIAAKPRKMQSVVFGRAEVSLYPVQEGYLTYYQCYCCSSSRGASLETQAQSYS